MIGITFWILVVIVWFVASGKSIDRFVNNGATDLVAWVLGAVGVLMLAWVLSFAVDRGARNPCVCIERGEWVK